MLVVLLIILLSGSNVTSSPSHVRSLSENAIFNCSTFLPSNEACSGRGVCHESVNCTCTLPDQWSGVRCDLPVCDGLPSDSVLVCNAHGKCSSPGSCRCYVGWGGASCQIAVTEEPLESAGTAFYLKLSLVIVMIVVVAVIVSALTIWIIYDIRRHLRKTKLKKESLALEEAEEAKKRIRPIPEYLEEESETVFLEASESDRTLFYGLEPAVTTFAFAYEDPSCTLPSAFLVNEDQVILRDGIVRSSLVEKSDSMCRFALENVSGKTMEVALRLRDGNQFQKLLREFS